MRVCKCIIEYFFFGFHKETENVKRVKREEGSEKEVANIFLIRIIEKRNQRDRGRNSI